MFFYQTGSSSGMVRPLDHCPCRCLAPRKDGPKTPPEVAMSPLEKRGAEAWGGSDSVRDEYFVVLI